LICDDLDIHEREYFGIFVLLKNDQRRWIRHSKELRGQLKAPWIVKFGVKLYPPDPTYLMEEITRLYVYRQIRDDIAKGRLLASFVTHSLLGALAAQAEIGNAPKVYGPVDLNNLLSLRLAPNVSTSLLERISELHLAQRGTDTAQAEIRYLETSSQLAFYGLHQFHVRDAEKVDITLGVHHGGIFIFEKGILLNRLAWPAIIELSYKRDLFFVKVRAGSVANNEAKIGFVCPTSGTAKRIWRIAVEHHHFFRKEVSGAKDQIKSKTQQELVRHISQLNLRPDRSSIRRARSIRSSKLFMSQENIDTEARSEPNSSSYSMEVERAILLDEPKINELPPKPPSSASPSNASPQRNAATTSSSNARVAPPKPLRRSRLNLTISTDKTSSPTASQPGTPCTRPQSRPLSIQDISSSSSHPLQADFNENAPLMDSTGDLHNSYSLDKRGSSLTGSSLTGEQRSKSLLQLRRSFMES
jgi:hypothetical protein